MSDYDDEFNDSYDDEDDNDPEEEKERGILDVFDDAIRTYSEHTSFYNSINKDYKTLKKSGEKIPFAARAGMFALNEIVHPLDNKQQLRNFKSDLSETINKKLERSQHYEDDETEDYDEEDKDDYTTASSHRSYTREEVEQVLPYMTSEEREAVLFYLDIEEQRRQGKKTILDDDFSTPDPLSSYGTPLAKDIDDPYGYYVGKTDTPISTSNSRNDIKRQKTNKSSTRTTSNNKDTSLKNNSSNFSFFSDDIGDDGKIEPAKKKSPVLNRLKASVFKGKKISIDKSSSILIGKNYEDVKNKFKELGFKNIHIVPLNDIYIGVNAAENTVASVTVDGRGFEKNDELTYTSNVIIEYHSKRKIKFPFSHKQLLKMAAIEAERGIRQAGYTNLSIIEKKSLFKKVGTIKSATICENTSFEKDAEYYYDVPIQIVYYCK